MYRSEEERERKKSELVLTPLSGLAEGIDVSAQASWVFTRTSSPCPFHFSTHGAPEPPLTFSSAATCVSYLCFFILLLLFSLFMNDSLSTHNC